MAKQTAAEKFTVRFTIACKTNDSLSGMVQTEDQDEIEQRALFDDSGVATMKLPAGKYTYVWAVKMTPIQKHRYGIKVERIPDEGAAVMLRNRPTEQTTTGGEDVGFDDFTL